MKLKKMREIGKVVAYILKTLKKEIRIGMTGQELEKKALWLMKEKKVKSSIKGYRGFPAAICVSLNNEITHGIPDARSFKIGDLVSFDVACHNHGVAGGGGAGAGAHGDGGRPHDLSLRAGGVMAGGP